MGINLVLDRGKIVSWQRETIIPINMSNAIFDVHVIGIFGPRVFEDAM